MARDIMIVKDVSKPYWKESGTIHFGDVDPTEWESLFFTDLNIRNQGDYTAEKGDSQTYEDYYSKRISQIKEKFPLIVRTKDFYEDASFSKSEINRLIKEILSLKEIVKRKESIDFLNQLLEASEEALKNDAGIIIVAD